MLIVLISTNRMELKEFNLEDVEILDKILEVSLLDPQNGCKYHDLKDLIEIDFDKDQEMEEMYSYYCSIIINNNVGSYYSDAYQEIRCNVHTKRLLKLGGFKYLYKKNLEDSILDELKKENETLKNEILMNDFEELEKKNILKDKLKDKLKTIGLASNTITSVLEIFND